MDATTVFILIVIAIAAAAGGWFAGVARTARAAAMQHAQLEAQAAVARAERDTYAEQLDRQRDVQRELGAQARVDQAARDERERREQAVLRALSPVQESLLAMQSKIDLLERERSEQFGSVAEQLRLGRETDEALRSTTESLAGALRSSAARGVWGETQLRRIVESAGLTRYVDFELQSNISSDSGAGRPDLIVRLPGDKALAIDAKVPLESYLEASAIPVTAQGEQARRRKALMTAHVKAVRSHIDALAKKAYWAGLSSSPEFVVCFIPSESLLAAALDEDPALLDYAFSRRVALASPVNLWAVLKTVAYTWTQQGVSDEARLLFDLGNELYQRLSGLATHAGDLRRAIERTVESYNRFVGTLESRVLVTARRFPGIDETRLNAVDSPAPLDVSTRRITAPELTAEIGELRGRLDVESPS